MGPLIQRICAHKHTSGAALVMLAISACEALLPIWFPSHVEQFKATAHWLDKAAVMYAAIMAGDAPKPQEPPKP